MAKYDLDRKSNLSASVAVVSEGNKFGLQNLTHQKKSAVHDLTQVVTEDCLRVILESHKYVSKYHAELLLFSNFSSPESLHQLDEIKKLRSQSFSHMMSSLEQLLPQIDQVSLSDHEISKSLNQIISYLEYLRFESLRHLYLINSFCVSNENAITSNINFGSISEMSHSHVESEVRTLRKSEVNDIKRDINEIENTITKLSQKYFVFIPDIDDIKIWDTRNSRFSRATSFQIFHKFKFICCFCAPKYI